MKSTKKKCLVTKYYGSTFFFQTFPESEGWPFPQYFGACGRYIVEAYNGKSLEYYVDASFEKRVRLITQHGQTSVNTNNVTWILSTFVYFF